MAQDNTPKNDNDVINIKLNSTEYIEFCSYRKQMPRKLTTIEEVYFKGGVSIKGTREELKLLGYDEE